MTPEQFRQKTPEQQDELANHTPYIPRRFPHPHHADTATAQSQIPGWQSHSLPVSREETNCVCDDAIFPETQRLLERIEEIAPQAT